MRYPDDPPGGWYAYLTLRHQTPKGLRYSAYLASMAWAARRSRALARAKWTCQACGAHQQLNVHHLNYERLGIEDDRDLTVLCRPCHVYQHRDLGVSRHKRRKMNRLARGKPGGRGR